MLSTTTKFSAVCPCCETLSSDLLTQKNGYDIWLCGQCRHGWVHPLPSDQTLASYYESSLAQNQYAFPDRSVRKHSQRLTQWMEQALVSRGRLLDYGCGKGIHLETVRKSGWQAVGIDFSQSARALCLKRGLEVFDSLDSLKNSASGTSFDAITLWEVLEHSPSPLDLLKSLKFLLKPGGFLAFSMPNFSSTMAEYDLKNWYQFTPPEHLNYFTPTSLRALLTRAGLKVWNLTTMGIWNPKVDRFAHRIGKFFRLSEVHTYQIQSVIYKLTGGFYRNSLQTDLSGATLLCMTSPGNPSESLNSQSLPS